MVDLLTTLATITAWSYPQISKSSPMLTRKHIGAHHWKGRNCKQWTRTRQNRNSPEQNANCKKRQVTFLSTSQKLIWSDFKKTAPTKKKLRTRMAISPATSKGGLSHIRVWMKLSPMTGKIKKEKRFPAKCYKDDIWPWKNIVHYTFSEIFNTARGWKLIRNDIIPTNGIPNMQTFHTFPRWVGVSVFEVDGVIQHTGVFQEYLTLMQVEVTVL